MSELHYKNYNELRDWFETQRQEVAIMIATRSALRTLPVLNIIFSKSDMTQQRGSILLAFRAILIANSARWGITELATAAGTAARAAGAINADGAASDAANAIIGATGAAADTAYASIVAAEAANARC